MYDLISIGNIAIDFYFQGESLTFKDDRFRLAIGGKYFVNRFSESLGGGGANVAIGIAHHGLNTAVYGKIGNNVFQKIILDKFKEAKVSTDLIEVVKEYLNISTILLSLSGERSIINYETPHQKLIASDSDLNKLLKTQIIYLGNLPDVSFTEREKLMRFFNKHKIITVVNLGVKDCRRPKKQIVNFLKSVNILVINGHEFAEITKKIYEKIDFTKDFLGDNVFLRDKLVVVTDGEKGSHGFFNNNYYHQEAIQVKRIIDTTGCGDGYTAGFIAEYLKSKDVMKAMYAGATYAAKILSKIGAN